MSRTRLAAGMVAAVTVLAAANAHGVQQRTFVSSHGSDANPCKLTAPCATFAAAAAQTQDGGEIVALDAGQFGPVTVTQSIAIIGPRAVHAAIAVTSGAGVVVNAPGKHVRFEGLSVEGAGGAVGLRVDAAGLVLVERCTIEGFSDAGIRSSAGESNIFVHDTAIRDNAAGIVVDGATKIVVDRSHLDKNAGAGMRLGSGSAATVAKSVIAFNGSHGLLIQPATSSARAAVVETLLAENGGDAIHASASASASIGVSLSSSEIRRNQSGLAVTAASGSTVGVDVEDTALSDHPLAAIAAFNSGGTVKMTLSGNTIVRNVVGVANEGALIESLGNNTFNYNGANGAPLTLIPAL